ncbi:hypothetical protein [Nocardia sp. alder85J]|uniref:hypothetical protein n=1 Tax=Nocardia sp. alder85J TaxID=2862949 RepID=UPI001CD42470|nr:hypothetical protein [Nocardia sp. alder85J]MCX4093193.1 hypothetical protein [Nocardia sp. alder85J]
MTEMRERARDSGFGASRWHRYVAAFDRVIRCIDHSYYLEAIAILDSLITDRLTSRVGHVKHQERPALKPVGPLCKTLIGDPNSQSSLGAETDPQFRAVIAQIRTWSNARNAAMHETAKIVRGSDQHGTFDVDMEVHRRTALDGIELLQQFDNLDTADRKRAGKFPATRPNAFFPERRRLSAADGPTVPSWQRLRVIVDQAVEDVYRDERDLIVRGTHESAVVARIAYQIARHVERSDSPLRVDVEYNRDRVDVKRLPGDRGLRDRVRADLIVHERGCGHANLLVLEARKRLSATARADLGKRVEKFRAEFGYRDAVVLDLSDQPRLHWVSRECEVADADESISRHQRI